MYVGIYGADGSISDENEFLSEFSNPSGDGDQAHGVSIDSEERIVAGGFHTHLGPEEPPGLGPPSQSFGTVRFAAIPLLVQGLIPPPPPNGGFDSDNLGNSAVKGSEAALPSDPSALLQSPADALEDRGATDVPVAALKSAAPRSLLDDAFTNTLLSLREGGLS